MIALAVLAAVGCAPAVAPATDAPFAGEPAVSPPPTEPPSTLDPETAEARAFRIQYGLRSDLAWIEQVAADPAGRAGAEEYGVPLTPAEVAVLHDRRNPLDVTATELLTEIRAYGALFPDAYAGAYEDQRVAIGFVVLFSRDADRHGTALQNLLPSVVELDIRPARWSLAELERFRQRVEDDLGWLALGPARFLSAETFLTKNAVELQYLGPVDRAPAIAHYYGNPSWLSVERAGPLPWNGPRADLVIDVTEADGTPARDVQCDFLADDPEAQEGSAVRFATDATGRCAVRRLPVGGYEVVFERWVHDRCVEVDSVRVTLEVPETRLSVALPPR